MGDDVGDAGKLARQADDIRQHDALFARCLPGQLERRTADGVPGSVVVSQVAAGRKNRLWFELDGSTGSAAFDQEEPESFWAGTSEGSRRIVRDSNSGSAEQRRLSYLPAGHAQGFADAFAAFVADTYAAIDGETPEGLPTFADGLRSARIVDAVVHSSRASTWTEV